MEKKKVQYAIFVFSIIAVFLAILGYSVRRKLLEEKEIKAEIEKYNKYVAFYNKESFAILGDFRSYYVDTFTDGKGKLKKLKRVDLLKLNTVRQRLNLLDEVISKMETTISEKPEFKNTDNYVAEYLEIIKEEKKLDAEILDYYESGVYKEDNYGSAIFLHSKFLNVSRKSNEKYGIYVEVMKTLIKSQKEKEIERLRKKSRKAAMYMVLFINDTEEFSQILFSRKQVDFTKMEVLKLKDLISEMKKKYKNLEMVSDRQIKKEKYSLESYNKIRIKKKKFLKGKKKKIESKKDDEDIYVLLYEFSENYKKIIIEYNKMLESKKQ